MSTTWYELPGIARVSVHTPPGGQARVDIEPDASRPSVPPLGPLTIVGGPDDCLRLLLAWAWHFDVRAAYSPDGRLRVTSTQPDPHPAISEHGDLTTVGELRRGQP